MPSVGFQVPTQRRDLIASPLEHQRHRAMVDAGRHCLDPCRLCPFDHLLRHQCRGDIDVADRQPHQRVAHGPADDTRFTALPVQECEDAGQGRILEPGLVGD